MGLNNLITIEVAYARPDRQYLVEVRVTLGSTIQTVIQASGILTECPEIDLEQQKVGVFSKPRQLLDRVSEGDRIEIYRPLIIDPKEARRQRQKDVKKIK